MAAMKFSAKTGCTDHVHHVQITSHVLYVRVNISKFLKTNLNGLWHADFLNFHRLCDGLSQWSFQRWLSLSLLSYAYIHSKRKAFENAQLLYIPISMCIIILFWKRFKKWLPNLHISSVWHNVTKVSARSAWPSQPFRLFSQSRLRSLWAFRPK